MAIRPTRRPRPPALLSFTQLLSTPTSLHPKTLANHRPERKEEGVRTWPVTTRWEAAGDAVDSQSPKTQSPETLPLLELQKGEGRETASGGDRGGDG